MWYRRHECGFRMAMFFSAATAAGAFGGLLARGISALDGSGGSSGWRWIFILEGALTLCVGSVSYWVIKDYPSTATCLATAERVEVERRLAADQNAMSNEFHMKYFYQALRDWKIWVNCVIAIGIFTPLYSISLFLPTILKELGYSNNAAQLMTVPPYVAACICTLASNYFADKAGQRGIFMVGFERIAIAGFLLLLMSGILHVQYAGTFLAAASIFSLVPMIGAWNSKNVGGSLKREVGIAMQVGFGNLGGIIAAFVYQSKDEPRFIRDHAILIGLVSMSLVLTIFMTIYLRRENARRDALLSEQHVFLENYRIETKIEQREKGDNALFYSQGVLKAKFTDKDLPMAMEDDVNNDCWNMRSYQLGSNTQLNENPWPIFDHSKWTYKVWDFSNHQWNFLALVFANSQFEYKLHPQYPLPFTDKQREITHSWFSTVFEVEIHPAHIFLPFSEDGTGNEKRPTFAIKRLLQDLEEKRLMYQVELDALSLLGQLNHPHLIHALAAYTCDVALPRGALPVFSTSSKPFVAKIQRASNDVKYVDVPQKRHVPIEDFAYVKGRSQTLGTFSLAKTFPASDVLVNVALGQSSGSLSDSLSLSATCISCSTTGSAVVTTEGVKTDDSILGNIISFFRSKNPSDIIVNALDLNLEVQLDNLGGHFEFDISFAASGTYTINLFKSESPAGIQLNSNDKIGLLFTIDLTLTVSDSVDFIAGFDLVFPQGASFTINPLNGNLVSMNIGGAQVNSIPVQFKKGAACISAVIRLKFLAGVGLEVFGKGFDFESGVFFDPIQYKACITYDPKQACPLVFTENFYEEIGAYAKAAVDVDVAKFSGGPTAVSTFFTGSLPSVCIQTATSSSTVLSTTVAPSISGISTPIDITKPVASATSAPSSSTDATDSYTQESGSISWSHHPKSNRTSHPTGTGFRHHHHPSDGSGIGSHGGHHLHPTGSPSVLFGNSSVSAGPTTTATFATVVTLPTAVASGTGSITTVGQTDGVVGSNSDVPLTTSTLLVTSVYTITSCAPTVTDCPVGKVTSTILTTTTVCPGNQESAPSTVSSNAGAVTTSPTAVQLTTSTLTSTSIFTVTSCPPTVTNCPVGQVTSIIMTTTTICPVADAASAAASPSATGGLVLTSPPGPLPTTSQNPGDSTTRTIYTTSLYNITSCLSNVVHCPTSLTSEIIQTKTIIQYTTICPIEQSEFPSALPSAATSANAGVIAAASTTAPITSIVIISPVPLTPVATPIVQTFDTPIPTIAANTSSIVPYPVYNATFPPSVVATAVPTWTPSSINWVKVGGYTALGPAKAVATVPAVSGGVVATASPSSNPLLTVSSEGSTFGASSMIVSVIGLLGLGALALGL
ncbi:hypothetical protein G7Y89_g12079 [Cudoniella acicularis]|uniref:Major facilitator superfamily (MFS) profile domain-containing protein n=1 Tax=Cudoniella acicularis TaxID=354080 RepID=A0A8H4RC88_9HELO|nr:hypothetical protein G7Y89_g12079 [Cudoniella acicularis]